MRVPFIDLREQLKELGPDLDGIFREIREDCRFILGPRVEKFEKALASFCETNHAVGVGSGLSALALSLRGLGISPGDEVITQANTFIATVLAISEIGARPVLVDCDSASLQMRVEDVQGVLTEKTRAVIPVHLYGQVVDMDPLVALCHKRNLYLIEDACQAHGARYKGRRCGTFGDAGCFSFYPGKNLGACGDGGAVVTASSELAESIKKLRSYGSTQKYHHEIRGYNSRLDALQASILSAKLPHLEDWNASRRRIAARYVSELVDLDLGIPRVPEHVLPVYHLFVIRVPNRREFLQHMEQLGIDCGIHYPIPVHLQRAYKDLGYPKGSFPNAELAADHLVSLPIFPEMNDDQVSWVVKGVRQYFDKRSTGSND